MNYQQAVTEALTLVKRSEADQWRLAQLTWEQLEAGVSRQRWASDVGVHPSYIGRLFKMWQSLPNRDDVSARPSFNDAYKEISPASAYQPRQPDPRDNLPPKAKADLVQAWMRDPAEGEQVAKALPPEVFRQPAAAKAATEALTATPESADRTYQAARAAKIEHARSQMPPPPPKTDPKQERIIRIEKVADELIGRLADVLDPDLDRNGQTLAFLASNIDALSDHYRQRLARAVKELSARASEWEDRMLGISGHTLTDQGGTR